MKALRSGTASSSLVWRKEYRTRGAPVCHSPCCRTFGTVHCLRAFHRSCSAVDRGYAKAAETESRDYAERQAVIGSGKKIEANIYFLVFQRRNQYLVKNRA